MSVKVLNHGVNVRDATKKSHPDSNCCTKNTSVIRQFQSSGQLSASVTVTATEFARLNGVSKSFVSK
jgi:hypothetical protein